MVRGRSLGAKFFSFGCGNGQLFLAPVHPNSFSSFANGVLEFLLWKPDPPQSLSSVGDPKSVFSGGPWAPAERGSNQFTGHFRAHQGPHACYRTYGCARLLLGPFMCVTVSPRSCGGTFLHGWMLGAWRWVGGWGQKHGASYATMMLMLLSEMLIKFKQPSSEVINHVEKSI